MRNSIAETGIWHDVLDMPAQLQETLDQADGFDEVASLLTAPSVRRIIATGNGASYYVAQALWIAALELANGPEVVAVPGGLVARGGFTWREGDVLLAISSSGEFRDVIEAIEDSRCPQPFAAITASPEATISRAAGARAVVLNPHQRAITHTQAFCGAVLASLRILASLAGDDALSDAVKSAPEACQRAIDAVAPWTDDVLAELETPAAVVAYGTRTGWAAALENALLVKEIARVPCEGVETREGATAAMTGLLPEHLVLSLPTGDEDSLVDEADALCASLGATVLQAPGGLGADRRLAPITTFPAALALSAELALRRGFDVDRPAWYDTYFTTARRP